ncbi:MAG TPA: hypothetical protein VFE58_16640 [Tepidisphaeraceae bacterium]|jgi:hypothetical protein|nr:hypothetical protein [Tepidisphaeraceae bacterium]
MKTPNSNIFLCALRALRVLRGKYVFFVLILPLPTLASPWADTVYNYSPGATQESPRGSGNFFTDPSQALGPVSPLASDTNPSTAVVQLGQAGSITLGFNSPILNNLPDPSSPTNPNGVDFTIFGNSFEEGFAGSGTYYREPGFVEVARKNPDGTPGPFYLLLPAKLPADMIGGVDTGPGTTLLAGYADEHPVNASGDPTLPPDNPLSAGGDAFSLESAVLESSPGVPALLNGQPQFISLPSVDFIRITDVLPNDGDSITGFYTTDIDAVIDLPGTVPEPTLLLLLPSLMLVRRR